MKKSQIYALRKHETWNEALADARGAAAHGGIGQAILSGHHGFVVVPAHLYEVLDQVADRICVVVR